MPDDGYIDTVDEVVAALEQDPILVQQLAGNGHAEEVAQWFRDHAAELDPPVFVALTERLRELPDSRSSDELARLLHARLDEPGLYVVSAGGLPQFVAYDVDLDVGQISREAYGAKEATLEANQHSGLASTGEAALFLRAAAPDIIDSAEFDALLSEPGMALVRDDPDADFLWKPPNPWPLTAFPIIAALVVFTVAMVLLRPLADRWVNGRDPSRVAKKSGRSAELPSDQAAAALLAEARNAAARSGKRLDKALGRTAGTDAAVLARVNLAAALAEGLRTSDDLLEVIGADMLATIARARLSGDQWKPCYFNPRHGAATRTATVATLRVPSCTACSKALAAGKEPDTLCIPAGNRGAGKDYFARRSVWAATGFGSLADDFPEQVAAARTGRGRKR